MGSAMDLTGRLGGMLFFVYVLPQLILRPCWPTIMQALHHTVPGAVANLPTPVLAMVFGQFLVHLAVYIPMNLFFWALYRGNFPALQHYKVSPRPWPWQEGADASRAFVRDVCKAVALFLFNNICLGLPLGYLTFDFSAKPGSGQYGDIAESTFPSAVTCAWQLLVCLLCEDTMFYWSHRLLHESTWLYQHVHKVGAVVRVLWRLEGRLALLQ